MKWETLPHTEYKLHYVFKQLISTGIMYFAAQSCAELRKACTLDTIRYVCVTHNSLT